MIKFIKYWFVWTFSFVTLDGVMELGGFGTIYHQNLGEGDFMCGFFLSLVLAFFITYVVSMTIDDKI